MTERNQDLEALADTHGCRVGSALDGMPRSFTSTKQPCHEDTCQKPFVHLGKAPFQTAGIRPKPQIPAGLTVLCTGLRGPKAAGGDCAM